MKPGTYKARIVGVEIDDLKIKIDLEAENVKTAHTVHSATGPLGCFRCAEHRRANAPGVIGATYDDRHFAGDICISFKHQPALPYPDIRIVNTKQWNMLRQIAKLTSLHVSGAQVVIARKLVEKNLAILIDNGYLKGNNERWFIEITPLGKIAAAVKDSR